VPIRSNLPYLSLAFVAMVFLMLSCGASLHPDRLVVHVPSHFSGSMRISTCVAGAPAGEVTLDERGLGQTSLCPAVNHSVEIEVIGSDRSYKLSSSEVQILRTGDGIAISIEAHLQQ
jgi:hypothetical protein